MLVKLYGILVAGLPAALEGAAVLNLAAAQCLQWPVAYKAQYSVYTALARSQCAAAVPVYAQQSTRKSSSTAAASVKGSVYCKCS
jgi:hypothetical protein